MCLNCSRFKWLYTLYRSQRPIYPINVSLQHIKHIICLTSDNHKNEHIRYFTAEWLFQTPHRGLHSSCFVNKMTLSAEPSPQLHSFHHYHSLPPSSPYLPPPQFPHYSPSKRASAESDIDGRPRKYQKTDYPRRTRLISHSLVSYLGEHPTQPDQLQAALLAAKSINESFRLDPDSTMINAHQDPPSSQSELFDHTNPDSWEIERLRYHGINWLLDPVV